LAPARGIRWVLVPVGCIVGFVTNMAITSQTATAAAVGPILVPLMLAAGYSPLVAGATLVLGCSAGGSLLNPGEADVVAIHESSQAPMHMVLQAMLAPLAAGFGTAVAVFAAWSWRRRDGSAPAPPEDSQPLSLAKALLPPLPILLIFLMLPGVFFPALPPPFEKGLPVAHAMIAGTMIVLLVHRREFSQLVKAFFEGMGYAYVHVISLIVTSSCFIAGLTATGMTDRLVQTVSGAGVGGKVAAGFFPGLIAVISGSGLGPSVAFAEAVLRPLSGNPPLALDLGSLAAIAGSFGRTMSPVAAVVIFSATLTGMSAWQLMRRLAPALLVGYLAVLAVVIARG
jgi:DcuC family C4-dicarboxylate transporter